MTDTPILSTVSPALHPASVEPLAKAGEIVTKAAQTALRQMYLGQNDMQVAEQATRQQFGVNKVVDGSEIKLAIPYDKAVILHADLGARFAGIARSFDASLGTINDNITVLEGRIDKALISSKRDAMASGEAQDMRTYLRSIPANERMNVLHSANIDMCQAALASPYAAGLSKEQAVTLRSLSADRFCKADVEALSATKATHSHLLASSATFVAAYRKLLPTVKETPHSAATKALKAGA